MEHIDGIDTPNSTQLNVSIPEAHPVIAVLVGTTLSELALVLKAHENSLVELVPHRVVVVDSLPYEDMRTRLVQAGWSMQQVEAAIPRAAYFHLTTPFTEDFDFESSLNRSYAEITADPGVRRAATKPDAPGCAGIPVLGRARVESNYQELRDFFERHIQGLTQVRKETLALRPGVLAFVFTTYRGGTGTGATARVAAILRSVMNGGEIHLRAMMPCIYRGDNRSYANAFAALRENQHYHRYGGGLLMKDERVLAAPFDTVVYTFVSNRRQALSPNDALMQASAVLEAYRRAPTQSSILARRVDLADVMPFDHDDNPTHIAVETALSVRMLPPSVHEYLAVQWIHLELQRVGERFDEWCLNETLNAAEDSQARKVAEMVIDELNLNREHLLTRLDPEVSPLNSLRSFVERVKSTVATMRAANVRLSMKSFTSQVQDMFGRFETCWGDRSAELAKSLPIEITESVHAKAGTAPHVALGALLLLRDHLLSIARDARAEAEREKGRRANAGTQLGAALNAVQEARGILRFIREDEVARDASDKACDIALIAALARVQQERNEYLTQALADGLSKPDSRGKFISIPSATLALVHLKTDRIAATQEMYRKRREQIHQLLGEYAQRIQKRSPVFQRSLVFDGVTLPELDEASRQICAKHSDVPALQAYLEEKQDLQRTIAELLPLLPNFSDAGRSLSQSLMDAAKRNAIVQLLRNCQPFTPIDREIEEQQQLRNRLDSLLILEIPGGADGALADLFLREGIVPSPNHIVDSGDQEIRLYMLRLGLPYGAMQLIERYRERHDQYLTNPGSVTPYTVGNSHEIANIAPPTSNLSDHTLRLLYLAKAVLPNQLCTKPSGGYILRHSTEATNGFRVPCEEEFPNLRTMKVWLARRVAVRRALAADLNKRLDSDPSAYKHVLIDAWKNASGEEKLFLQNELFRLNVDPQLVA